MKKTNPEDIFVIPKADEERYISNKPALAFTPLPNVMINEKARQQDIDVLIDTIDIADYSTLLQTGLTDPGSFDLNKTWIKFAINFFER